MKGPMRVGSIPTKTQKPRTQIYMDLGYIDPHMGAWGKVRQTSITQRGVGDVCGGFFE